MATFGDLSTMGISPPPTPRSQAMQQRMSNLENQVNGLQGALGIAEANLQTATAEFRNQMELQFAGEHLKINEIVAQAKNEFDMIRSQTEARFNQLQLDTGAELAKIHS